MLTGKSTAKGWKGYEHVFEWTKTAMLTLKSAEGEQELPFSVLLSHSKGTPGRNLLQVRRYAQHRNQLKEDLMPTCLFHALYTLVSGAGGGVSALQDVYDQIFRSSDGEHYQGQGTQDCRIIKGSSVCRGRCTNLEGIWQRYRVKQALPGVSCKNMPSAQRCTQQRYMLAQYTQSFTAAKIPLYGCQCLVTLCRCQCFVATDYWNLRLFDHCQLEWKLGGHHNLSYHMPPASSPPSALPH